MRSARVLFVASCVWGLIGCAELTKTAKGLGEALFTSPEELERQEAAHYVYEMDSTEPAAKRNGRVIALRPTAMKHLPWIRGAESQAAGRLTRGLDDAVATLLMHRGFEVVRSSPSSPMTYGDKRETFAVAELVVLSMAKRDASRRLVYIDEPSAILRLTEPLSGELVAQRPVVFAAGRIEERYLQNNDMDPELAVRNVYRKLYKAATAALQSELTAQTVLAAEPDVQALKKKHTPS